MLLRQISFRAGQDKKLKHLFTSALGLKTMNSHMEVVVAKDKEIHATVRSFLPSSYFRTDHSILRQDSPYKQNVRRHTRSRRAVTKS